MNINRSLSLAYGLSRVAFGIVAIAAPRQLGRTWVGDDADSAGAEVVFRALGGRDIALGAGTAAATSGAVKPWLASCVIADLGDLAGTLIGRNGLPDSGVRNTALVASVAALAGIVLIAFDDSDGGPGS